MKKILLSVALVTLLAALAAQPARADVAPPQTPPGANLAPGAETTQVRMMSETVTLTVAKDPANAQGAIAQTDANFTMLNIGNAEETMQVRFPLTFFDGASDGFGKFPEISDLTAKVNGRSVPVRREIQPFIPSESGGFVQTSIPWDVFTVTFPPSQEVNIEVAYTVVGYGYYPYLVFRYILETGAGWNGTIGSADVIVHFSYEANPKNVWVEGTEYSGYGETTPGGVLSGNEVHWHFENFEPTSKDNLQVVFAAPSLWETVLKDTEAVENNPNDGEMWGMLGKAYKEILRLKHGELREDTAGKEMFRLSREAYEKCLTFLPKDSLWHYGYADLLWSQYYFDIYMPGKSDVEGILPLLLSHLKTALDIDPHNQQAKDLLIWISNSIPESVTQTDSGYVFLGLTATPPSPTPYNQDGVTKTPPPAPTSVPSTKTASAATLASPALGAEPTASNPICGSAAMIFIVMAGAVWFSRRK